ncbi:MAG: xanthine dehydrogenase family protein subunit M, partial [Calditrichaeota bacterium]|nr:xanthine dehydrogenase family protein subunit M [Calditrichota bacterium]
ISVVGAAAAVVIENGKVINARIALGAVAPRPLLVSEATETLIGKELTDENISEAASIASKKARPITDHRGGASYRKAMVKVLVERVLKLSRERALGGQGVEALS